MNLYLGIPPDSGIGWSDFAWLSVVNYLKTWLNSCSSNPVRVITVDKKQPQMGPLDGLVYLVGQPDDSVISRVGVPESRDLHIGSTSSVNGEMISEVSATAPYSLGGPSDGDQKLMGAALLERASRQYQAVFSVDRFGPLYL